MGRQDGRELPDGIAVIGKLDTGTYVLTLSVYRYLGGWGNMGESPSSFARFPDFWTINICSIRRSIYNTAMRIGDIQLWDCSERGSLSRRV